MFRYLKLRDPTTTNLESQPTYPNHSTESPFSYRLHPSRADAASRELDSRPLPRRQTGTVNDDLPLTIPSIPLTPVVGYGIGEHGAVVGVGQTRDRPSKVLHLWLIISPTHPGKIL